MKSIISRKGALAVLTVMLSFGFAAGALAAPTLFVIKHTQQTPAFAPTTPSGSGTLSAGPSSLTVPTNAFGTTYQITGASFPGYPAFTGTFRRYNRTTGDFVSGYRTATSSSFTIVPNTTMFPNGTTPAIQRNGTLFWTVGSQAFGGNMELYFNDYYVGIANVNAVGTYDFAGYNYRVRGFGPPGSTPGTRVPITGVAGYITSSHQTMTFGGCGDAMVCPLTRKLIVGQEAGPWFTGTVMANNTVGYFKSLRTTTGTDNRTTMGTMGTISLVTPTLNTNFNAFGTIIQAIAGTFSYVSKVKITLLPEPSRIALMAGGLLGLFGLYRLQRRC